MIDNETITALAREYAEEMIKGKPFEELPNCLKNSMLEMNTEYVAGIFQWLTRRYALVEKGKAIQIYQAKQHILANQNVFGITVATEAAAQKRLMFCLFPEIAKEVE